MIEFKGHISGKAKKHFWKVQKAFSVKMMIVSVSIIAGLVAIVAISSKLYFVLQFALCILLPMVLLTAFMPQSKKDKQKFNPNRIFTDQEYIVSQCEVEEVFKVIDDARVVYDYGEFYDIRFAPGNASLNFICQKDLLVQGTLEEFEALFEGKIERKY